MFIEMAFFVGSQLFAALIFTAIALVAVKYRHSALQREIVVVGAEKRLPLEGYQRFVAACARILFTVVRANTIVLLIALMGVVVVLLFITLNSTAVDSLINFFQLLHYIILLLPAFLIGLFVAAYIHGIVGAVFVDADALRLAQMSTLERDDIFMLKIKAVFLKLVPLILYLEVLGVLILLGYNLFVGLLVLLSIAGIASIVKNIFAFPFYSWTNSLHPIEQTQWAFLAPRIAAWAQLAGVNFASVQVQQDLVGTVNVRIIGLGRPTLIISETFLRYAEWRQQDAMIGVILGLVRKHMVRKTFLRTLSLLLLSIVFVASLQLLPWSAFNSYFLIPLPFVFYGLRIVVRIVSQRFLRTIYFDADRLAAHLTGDPMAVMVALNTVNALNGVLTVQKSVLVPSTSERMLRLDVLIRQPWPRAPQASIPVPASTAVSFGPYYLTMPLERASAAGPVPSAPYMILV